MAIKIPFKLWSVFWEGTGEQQKGKAGCYLLLFISHSLLLINKPEIKKK